MEYLILVILSVLVGWIVGRWLMRLQMKIILQKMIDEETRDVISAIPSFHTELDNGMVFLYDSLTTTFMCQGISLADIARKLNSDCHIPFAQVNHNGQMFIAVDGLIKNAGE